MLKWFAPLLLFAGKPEVLLRLLIAVLAGVVLFFGVWLLSNIAVTFDTLKNPAIAAAYAVVLLLFFVVVGTVAWLRLRRLTAPARRTTTLAEPERPPLTTEIVSKRAKELANKWDAESRRADRAARKPAERVGTSPQIAPAAPPHASSPARSILTVTGPAYAGKTALIAMLVEGSRTPSPDASELVRLADAGPTDGDDRHVEALVARAAQSDGVLFVVDQDLRAPEVTAIKRLIATGKPLYVVLNKADQFTASDRDAIMVSIRAKMPKGFAPGHVVAAAGAPTPVEREIEDARGAVRVESRRPSSDVASLLALLGRVVTPGAERTLRFERGS